MKKYSLLLFFVAVSVFYSGCRKESSVSVSPQAYNEQRSIDKFLTAPANATPALKSIIADLRKKEQSTHFLASFIKNNGIPVWEKTVSNIAVTGNPVPVGSPLQVNDVMQPEKGVFFIPLVDTVHKEVSSYMVCTPVSDTSYKYQVFNKHRMRAEARKSDTAIRNGKPLLGIISAFDNSIYGKTQSSFGAPFGFSFNNAKLNLVTGSSISNPVSGNSVHEKHVSFVNPNDGDGPCEVMIFLYSDSYEYVFSYNTCTGQSVFISTTDPYFGQAGGSDPGIYGDPGDYGDDGYDDGYNIYGENDPLPPGIDNGSLGNPFWEFVSHGTGGSSTYTLTPQDQQIFAAIDQEDNDADNTRNNPCHGTNRTGNIDRRGTLEHWLIQVDYVATNPLAGEVEYSVPGSSSTGSGRTGYADLVNTYTAEMFEIKPNNDAGLTSGRAEVQIYVDKANLNCPPAPGGLSSVWSKGTGYTTKYLPSKDPDQYLEARLAESGVILYKYVARNTNPSPAPIAVPQSALDKLRNLINKLKNNLADADRIIADYMHQNPDLVNYIKGAAIGAAIGIVVGTIIEDIATLGAGVADDWASFALAYRIVRFAWAL